MEITEKFALALAILVVLLTLIRSRNKKKRDATGNKYAPAASSMFHLLLNFRRVHDFFVDLCRRYKTFRISYPTFDYIYSSEPASIEHIMKTNFENYGKGTYHSEILGDLLGDGIFAVDGELWKQQRKKASLEFSTRVLRDFSSSVFRENAVKICRELMRVCMSYQTVELQALLLKSNMITICKVGFGIDLGAYSDPKSAIDFANAFDYANSVLLWRYFDPLWKLKRYFNVGAEAKLKECIKTVDNFLYPIINTRCHEVSTQKDNERSDILSRFIAMGNEGNAQDGYEKYLRDVVLNFIIAGRDTTAITLCWFFYSLCKNPHVEVKIVSEIQSIINLDMEGATFESALEMFHEKLNYSALDRMHYLQAALSETLRLYPAVPLESKCAFADDILPDGTIVKKGDMVGYSSYGMGRLTDLWGSDAEEFKPERWLDNNGVYQQKSPFLYTAFQAGPRTCLGKDFAYMQMKIMASFLLSFFKFESIRGKEPHYALSLTLHMTQEGLNLHIKPRLGLRYQ